MRRSATPHRNSALFAKTIFCFVLILFGNSSAAQTSFDSLFHKLDPQKWSASVSNKVTRLEEKIISKSERTLHKLQVQEERTYEKMLHSKDSLQAKGQLERVRAQYASLREKVKNDGSPVLATNIKDYIPHLDTLQSVFGFLDKTGFPGNVKETLVKLRSLNTHFQQASEIRQFIRQRRDELKQKLLDLGMVKELKQFNKEVFYYSEQIREYKEIINDPAKRERKAIELLFKTRPFVDFFKTNSVFASLFRPQGNSNDPNYLASLAGLQTRASVNSLIQQQIAGGGPNAMQQFQQNLQTAQSELNQLKSELNKFGGSSSDDIMPEGFKPNNEKTKSFLKRLELGTSIQTQRATSFFPVTSDLAVSVGYRVNNKSIIGIGASYKLGLGRGWQHINLSSEGVGLRSYIDLKLKGSFWITGGYELNYRNAFNHFDVLKDMNAWQRSGLIGVSKTVPVKTKFFKKTKLQLLWDCLSYQQIPRTQPIIFRIEYGLK